MAEIIQYACGMSNGFFVKGDKGVIAVDTGDLYGEDVAQKIFEENGINPKDVILIIITHGHPDHMRNVEAFKKLTGAPVLMHEGDAHYLIEGKLPGKELMPRNEFGWKLDEMFSKMEMPPQYAAKCDVDIIMTDEVMDMEPYGVDGYLFHTPGHSHGSICLIIGTDALIGDVFSSNGAEKVGMMPFLHASDAAFEDCQISVQKLLDRGVQTFYSGHGGPYTREYVQEKLDEEIMAGK